MTNRVVWANLLHRKTRTIVAILAIGVEVSMILLMLGLADGLVGESSRRQRGVGADILIRPSTSSAAWTMGAAGLPESLIEELETLPGVTIAVGTTLTIQSQLTTVTGVDLERFGRMSGEFRILEGDVFQEPFDVIVDDIYARQKKFSVGQTVQFLNRDFRLVGITESGRLSRVFVPIETMQEVMGWEGKLSQIYLKLEDPNQTAATVARIKKMLPRSPVYPMDEFVSLFQAQTRGKGDEFVSVMLAIAVAVGFIVVLMSMYTAVLERTRDIGILKALGASPGFVVRLFVRETLVLTIAGILIGTAFAFGAQAIVEQRFPLVVISILDRHLFWAYVISVLASLMGALLPAVRAARQDVISAIAYE